MGYANAIKSGYRACEGLFAKAPLRHTAPEGFVKAAKAGEVKICPNFIKSEIGDIAHFTETTFKKPSAERLKELLEQLKIGNKIPVNENNSLFLEELASRFPLKQGETTNKVVEDLMVCLEDINHTSFANKREFLNQFLEDYKNLDKFVTKEGKTLFTDLYTKRAVIQAKYNNPARYKDIMDLYGLYKQGKAPKYVLQTLYPESEFHALPKSDMLKLLRGENYYPKLESLSTDIISKLPTGEAFSCGKEMFVKTEKGFEKLKIDKDTYEKLFPPIERYCLAQGPLKNCHLMATIDALTKNPTTRIDLLRMFEQTENGVKCTIAGYKGQGVIYDFSNLEYLYTENNLKGSLGHKILEHTYAKNEYDSIVKLAENGQLRSEEFLKTHKTPLEVFDIEGDSGDIEKHVNALIGKSVKTIVKSNYTPEVINTAQKETTGINLINCVAKIIEKKGLTDKHFYHGNLENNTMVNPWNTMEQIFYNPFNLDEITYMI